MVKEKRAVVADDVWVMAGREEGELAENLSVDLGRG